jgi:tetratricopeptide (TPR) repeat protein
MDRPNLPAPLPRRHSREVGALAAVLVALASPPATGQDPLLWGSLKPGPNAVGYRALYRFDHTRQYDPEFVTDPTKPPLHKPRPIFITVWYPAQETDAKPMEYRQYLDVSSDDALIAPFVKRLSRHVVNVVSEEAVGKEPANRTPVETAAFERLLATRTFAVKDAPPAEGRFPVVIHHPGLGGTPDDNSVLFELLASHGYVVLSSAYPNNDAQGVAIGSDLHTSFRDLEFLSRFARELPFADADRLGAMGHSWGAIAVLHWAALPDSVLRAFVTLDSGFEYGAVEDCGVEALVFHMRTNEGNIRAAALRFASTERNPNFDFLESHLRHAPRYEAAVASLTHNDYLTHGAIRPALLPEKWPDPKGARRTSYDRLCRHVLLFFDAMLKQQVAAREGLQESVRGDGLDDGFKLKFKPATPAPPTVRQLAKHLKQHGVEKTLELVRSIPDTRPNWVAGAASTLVKEGDATAALPAHRWAVKEYPKNAIYQIWLGQALAVTGDRAGALAAYRKAAELFPHDETLDNELVRQNYKYLIDKGLKDLGRSEPQEHR